MPCCAAGFIGCSAEKCYTAFHPLCAFFANYHMRMDEHEGAIRFRAYCKRHTDDIASEVARQAAVVMPPEFLQLKVNAFYISFHFLRFHRSSPELQEREVSHLLCA